MAIDRMHLAERMSGKKTRDGGGPLVKVPSTLMTKSRANLTQWNGRMVMETAFNLHRRSPLCRVVCRGKTWVRRNERKTTKRGARASWELRRCRYAEGREKTREMCPVPIEGGWKRPKKKAKSSGTKNIERSSRIYTLTLAFMPIKRALSLIYRFSRIFYSDYALPANQRISLWLAIADP